MDTETRPLPDAKTLFARMCIDGTRFQAHKFVSAVESYEGLREALEHGKEITSNYPPLLSDVFSAFFQNKARLKQNPPWETEENREIMKTALGLKEYEELHSISRLDFFASAAATRAFSDQIQKLIKDKKEENEKDPQSGKANENKGPLGVDPDTLRWAIRRSLKKGLEEAQDAKQAVETFGREEGGIKRIPITEQFRLADLLGKNPKIKQIVKMLGRMRLEALSIKRSRITHSATVRRGVETVGIEGIDRVLPDELAALAIGEEGEKLFLKKLLDEDLLAYNYKNPVDETHGPILIAVDGSGSMAGPKEIWAKALAIATILQAKKEKRKSHGVIFGASEKEIFDIDVDRLEDLATASFHMGTNFGPPLTWAKDHFRENPRADFLFITDGICNLESDKRTEFIQAKSRSGAKCYSVLIGSESTETVKQFSDKVFYLTTTPNAREGGQILAEIEGGSNRKVNIV
jgi:uncharacterized protein with von Willebrand factor type A (vWA) domain